jgi:hypothetical protein
MTQHFFESLRTELKWWDVLRLRAKKIVYDISSIKNLVLGAVMYGVFTNHVFDISFYVFAAAVLGLKEMPALLLAFRGQIVHENSHD